jgi:hypothetical protein
VSRTISSKSSRKPAGARRKRASSLESGDARRHGLSDVIASIQRNEDWPRILELYYWSCEPGVLDLIRTLMAMPERTRASLEAFCAMAHEPGVISGELDAAGRLILTSVHLNQAVAILRYSTDEDDPERPLRPN